MIDKSEMEARAVKDARRALAEALVELGLMDAFRNRSAAEIDRVIEACIDGFQASMRRQAAGARGMRLAARRKQAAHAVGRHAVDVFGHAERGMVILG